MLNIKFKITVPSQKELRLERHTQIRVSIIFLFLKLFDGYNDDYYSIMFSFSVPLQYFVIKTWKYATEMK